MSVLGGHAECHKYMEAMKQIDNNGIRRTRYPAFVFAVSR